MALTFSFVANEIYAAWMTSAKLDRTIGLTQDSEIAKNQKNIINAIYLTISDPLGLKNRIGERICVDSEKAGKIIKGHKPHREIIKHCLDNALETNMPAVVEQNIVRYLDPNKIDTLIDHLQKAVLEDSDLYNSVKKDILEKASRTYLPVFLMRVIRYSLNKWNISEDMVHSKVYSHANQHPEPSHNSAKIVSHVITPVSKEHYVSRPGIENDIAQSLRANRITIIRGLSGLGKSELARKVTADETDFSTVIRLELGNDGSGDFEKLLDKQVGVINVPSGKDPLEIKKNLLRIADSNSLIIVDNFNDINNQSFMDSLANSIGNAKVLLTSQVSKEKLVSPGFYLNALHHISPSVIDVEAEKYIQKQFAPRVFCAHAGLTYEELSDEELSAICAICNHVTNHTMLVSALGLRMIKYGSLAKSALIRMTGDLEKCMFNISVKLQKDLKDPISLTPYEILKELSSSLLQRKYTERERQVLGALILMPSWTHILSCQQNTNNFTVFMGDSIEDDLFEADKALQRLHNDGILNLCGNGKIELHPLYQKLFSDASISFCDECGKHQSGPIADLSAGFRQHLLRNACVSLFKDTKLHVFDEVQELLQNLLFTGNEIIIEDITDQGWIAFCHKKWLDDYSLDEIASIQACIKENHRLIGDGRSMSDTEAKNIFFSDLGKGLLHPKHPSAFFVVEHEKGRSLWIYDTVDKKAWCTINLQNQRSKENRYYKEGMEYTYTLSESVDASLICFFMMHAPEVLIIPDRINDAPVKVISTSFKESAGNVELLSIAPTVTHISEKAFLWANELRRAVILGKSCSIGPLAFSDLEKLEYFLFAKDYNYIGAGAFTGDCDALTEAILPPQTIMDTFFFDIARLDVRPEKDITIQQCSKDGYKWIPTPELLEREPQLRQAYLVATPFLNSCNVCIKKENVDNRDIFRTEISGVFSHIKWCLSKADSHIEKGAYYVAGEYLRSIVDLLTYRTEYFTLKTWSNVFISLARGFANCQMYDNAYVCISQVDATEIKSRNAWLFYFGFILGKLGEHQKAMPYKTESLEYSLKCVNDANEDTIQKARINLASEYNSIAESCIALKEHQRAHEYLHKCLEIRQALLPPDDISFALLYENFGDLYAASGKECFEYGHRCYKQAISIFSTWFGNDHKNVLRVQQKLSALNIKLEQMTN